MPPAIYCEFPDDPWHPWMDLTDAQLMSAVEDTAAFARVNPSQKLRLVEALQIVLTHVPMQIRFSVGMLIDKGNGQGPASRNLRLQLAGLVPLFQEALFLFRNNTLLKPLHMSLQRLS